MSAPVQGACGKVSESSEDSTPEQEMEVICRKFRGLLNKLTPQNFGTVLAQFKELNIRTEDQLDAVCKIMHEKAISEPKFAVAYANMFKAVGTIRVPKRSTQKEFTNARAILLTYCQIEFEAIDQYEQTISAKKEEMDNAPEEKIALMKEELEALILNLRRRSTGNIRFICELFKLKMLTENIMHECIYKLLKAETEEEYLECMCYLLKMIGADLDTDRAKARMNQYFNTIKKIIDAKSTSSRIRCMLLEIVDLRRERWVPRRPDNTPKTPKTFAQVHQEYNREATEKQMKLQGQQNMPPSSRRGRGSKSQRGQQNEKGWNTVVSTSKSMRNNPDPNKLKFTKTQVDDNVQLGPGGGGLGRMGWSRGSSGGSARTSQEGERPSTPSNRKITGGLIMPSPQGTSMDMTREEIEIRSKAILDEYLGVFDQVAELQGQPDIHVFVFYCFNSTLEREKETRNRTGKLLQNLFANNLISMDSLLRGLREVLEFAEDLAVDSPKVYEYLAELLSPIIVLDNDRQRKALLLGEIGTVVARELRECGKAKVLMVLILRELSQKMPHKEVKDMWGHSRLSWTDFLQPGENVDEFLRSKNLDFMLSDAPTSPAPTQNVSAAWVEQNLSQLLALHDSKNETIFSWIEENVPEDFRGRSDFIRPLMTAVCRAAVHDNKVSVEMINKRQALLRKYLYNSEECELQALFALQALVHSMQHPPGVLREFFEFLYDEDLISEEGFMQWMRNTDPQEQEGKGVALKQVVHFFLWLQEAEDDSTPKC